MPLAILLSILLLFNSVMAYSLDFNSAISAEPIQPIPSTITLDPSKVALGKKLFEDPFIAHNKKQSCSQCHQLNQGGVDNSYRSRTNTGKYDVINTPTIFNVAYNLRHTWRGKFKSLEMQAQGDLHNPRHANTTWKELLPKLESRPDYQTLFSAIYDNQHITKDMVLNALSSYEKSLITPNAPFDQYLRGNKSAISEKAQRGYQRFKDYGCSACHQGINIGGNMFQKIGIFGDYFYYKETITQADYGRFNVTGLEKDRFVFRVPSLRNIALTAPYFHDGKTKTLKEAIKIMARHQLGREISKQHTSELIAFLHSLTGEYNGHSLKNGLDK